MIRESVLHMERYATTVVVKTTLNQSVSSPRSNSERSGKIKRKVFSESVANVAIGKWTVLNTAKSRIIQMSQIQTQKELRI